MFPVETHSSRGAGWLCRCQELILSPVEQPMGSDDDRSYYIGALVSCVNVMMSAMYRAAAVEWPVS